MILIEAGWSRPWLSGVLASDDSLSGNGVAQAFWSTSDVAAVGRVREVRRLRCGAIPARRHVYVLVFRVDASSGEVLRDCFGRPQCLSTRDWLR